MLAPSGCRSAEEAHFNEEELEWLVYEANDTLRFQSPAGKGQLLVVDNKTELSQIKDHYPIEAELDLVDTTGRVWFKLYLLKDKSLFKKYFRAGDVYRNLELIDPIASLQLGERQYQQVYVIIEDTTTSDADPWKVYFNKTLGVVGFEMRNQAFFHLSQ